MKKMIDYMAGHCITSTCTVYSIKHNIYSRAVNKLPLKFLLRYPYAGAPSAILLLFCEEQGERDCGRHDLRMGFMYNVTSKER